MTLYKVCATMEDAIDFWIFDDKTEAQKEIVELTKSNNENKLLNDLDTDKKYPRLTYTNILMYELTNAEIWNQVKILMRDFINHRDNLPDHPQLIRTYLNEMDSIS